MQKGLLVFNNDFAELQGTVMSSSAQKGTDSTLPPTQGCNLSYILVTLSQVLVWNNNVAQNDHVQIRYLVTF